jgi:extradiol dioxygenase family protein
MPASILGLQHAAMPFPGSDDAIADARRFYGELIGLAEREAQLPGVLWFDAGRGTELHLYSAPDEPNEESHQHPCLEVTGLDELRARMKAAGLELIEPEGDMADRRRFFAFDPFGNAIEFLEFVDRPPRQLNGDD